MPYLGDLEPGSPLELDDGKRNIAMNKNSEKYMKQQHHMKISFKGGWSYKRNCKAIIYEIENDEKLKGTFNFQFH